MFHGYEEVNIFLSILTDMEQNLQMLKPGKYPN